MRIRNISKSSVTVGKGEEKGRQLDPALRPKFAEELGKVKEGLIHERLDTLLKDIDEQAKSLANGYNINDLVKYKTLVKNFLQEAVQKMYKIKEEVGWDRRGRHKVYSLVEVVDKELEELTHLVMSEQKDNISILKKLDEIKGMLVDIYS